MGEGIVKIKQGRPPVNKKYMSELTCEELVDHVSESLKGDVHAVEIPNIGELSELNQLIFSAYVAGYSHLFIARALGMQRPNVTRIIDRIDPERRFRLSKEARKAFLTNLLQSKAMEALTSITPEKLDESSAKDLIAIARTSIATSEQLNQTKHKETSPSRLDNLLGRLEAETISRLPAADVSELDGLDAELDEELDD